MAHSVRAVAFIDPDLTDIDVLFAGLRPDVAGVVLNRAEPAPRQMARHLVDLRGLEAIHVLAHGAPGEVAFAGGTLSPANAENQAGDFATMGRALRATAGIMLWSCRTGAGADGSRLTEVLARVAGVNVMASSGRIGNTALGGRWELDPGPLAAIVQRPLTSAGVASYAGVMSITIDTASITTIATDTGNSSTDFITADKTLTIGGQILAVHGGGGGTLGIWLSGGGFGNGQGTLFGSVAIGGVGPWSFDLATSAVTAAHSLTNGTYAIHITSGTSPGATDLASSSLIEDTSAPQPGAIVFVTDDVTPVAATLISGDRTNDFDLTLTVGLGGTGVVAGNTIQLYSGNGTASPLGIAYSVTAADISNGFANVQTGALIDGATYTITARTTDLAGNQSSVASNSFTVTVDESAPGAPLITSVTDDVGPVTGLLSVGASTDDPNLTMSVSLAGTGVAVGDSVQLYDGSGISNPLGVAHTLTAADIIAVSANVQTGTLVDGHAYAITARITDRAGNESAASGSFAITEDITAPGTPSITSVNDDVPPSTGPVSSGGTTNDPDLTVTVSLVGIGAAAGDTVHLYDGTDTSNPLGVTLTLSGTDITNGFANVQTGTLTNSVSHSITARVSDKAGNEGPASNSFAVIEDGAPPAAPSILWATDNVVPVTAILSNGAVTNDPDLAVTVTLSDTGTAGDSLRLYNGSDTANPLGVAYTLTATDIGIGFASVLTGKLEDGTTYAITARVADQAGNQSPPSATFTVVEDTTAPGIPSIASVKDDVAPVTAALSDGASTNDPILTVSVGLSGIGATAGDTIQFYNGSDTGNPIGAGYALTSADIGKGAADVQVGTLTDGATYSITARITDQAGDQSAVSGSFTVTEDRTAPDAPSITSVTDNVAPVTGILNGGASTNDPALTVRVDLTGTGVGANDTVSLFNGGGTSIPLGGPYVLTSADVTAGFADVQTGTLANGTYTITARVTDQAGNQSTFSTNFAVVTEDTTAPVIGINAIAIDNLVDPLEAAAGFSISGTTDAGAGEPVTVKILDASNHVADTYSTSAGSGIWSVRVTPTQALALGQGAYTVQADVSDAAGNPAIEASRDFSVVCYARGTHIETPTGQARIEDLRAGDSVVTVQGNDRIACAIKWIGRRWIDLLAHPRPEMVEPVRIRRGAFEENMPYRDLLVSPDHGVLVDGKLISTRQLVNGSTIHREIGLTFLEYFHVELYGHAILLAEGLPAESYLNTGNLGFFANSGEPLELHPHLTDETDYPTREAESCAPFVWDEASVRPVWQRLAERAEALGQPAPKPATNTDPGLRIVASGRTLWPLCGDDGHYIFALPKGATEIRLVSRTSAPTDVRPWLDDRRCLGIYVERILLRGASEIREVPLDHPALSRGWWAVEQDGTALRRWTGGNAVLPLPKMGGPMMLEIRASAGGMIYLNDPDPEARAA
jgi:hypothetical protein